MGYERELMKQKAVATLFAMLGVWGFTPADVLT